MTENSVPDWVEESAKSAPDEIDAENVSPDKDREMDREPTHPGAYLERALDQSDLTVQALAEITDVSRQTLYKILGEEWRISTELAVRLSAVFEPEASFWVSKSMDHELHEMKEVMNGEADAIRDRLEEHKQEDEPART
jgi:addiction module HigA family antidote